MITPIEASHVSEAAAVLGAAFRDTPVFAAALRGIDDAGRERKLTTLFTSFIKAAISHGQPMAVSDGDKRAGVALIYPPGKYPLSFAGWLRNGIGALSLGPARMITLARVDSYLRKRHYQPPHWYLYVLGVAPAVQGKGFGGQLLRDMTARADRERVACYLETDDPKNVGYYQRFGFEVTFEGPLPSLPDVTMWHMLRAATTDS